MVLVAAVSSISAVAKTNIVKNQTGFFLLPDDPRKKNPTTALLVQSCSQLGLCILRIHDR